MYETNENSTFRLVEPGLPADDSESFLFIEFTEGQGWVELESALMEGTIDDLSGRPV